MAISKKMKKDTEAAAITCLFLFFKLSLSLKDSGLSCVYSFRQINALESLTRLQALKYFPIVKAIFTTDTQQLKNNLRGGSVIKPACKVIGEDGNIFNLLSMASKALKNADESGKAKEMTERVLALESYDEGLQVIMEYIEVE